MRGVAADALNQVIVTGGSDGKVKFWKFVNKGNILKVELLVRTF